jgi:hypothetical protein
MHVEDIARVAHEVNKAYCETIGDHSQKPWEEAADWQKQSALNGVRMQLDNPSVTPEDLHKSWLKEKADAGWTWGPTKNVEKKEHPCFIEYSRLPQEQTAKDYLFRAVVQSLTKHLGGM